MKFLDLNGVLYLWNKMKAALDKKVDKADGKGLSANDYTTDEKTKLAGLHNYTLPAASTSTLGGVRIGAGLAVNGGLLSVTGGGTADAVEWENILRKPDLVQGKQLNADGAAGTVAALKAQIHAAALAPGCYFGRVAAPDGFVYEHTDGATFDALEFTVFVAADAHKTLYLSSKTGRAFMTYSSASAPVVELTNRALTAASLTALHAVIDENYVHTDSNFTAAEKEKLAAFAAADVYARKSDLAGVYRYKGTKDSAADLPAEGNDVGDVWDVAGGMNYAWNGMAWDALGELIHMEGITNAEIDAVTA